MFRSLFFRLTILKMSPLIIAKVATNNLSNLMSQKQICRQIIYGMIYGTFFGSIVRNFNRNYACSHKIIQFTHTCAST